MDYDLNWTFEWGHYLRDTGLMTPRDVRRFTGRMLNDPELQAYVQKMKAQYPEHHQAFLTKQKLLGDNYEPER